MTGQARSWRDWAVDHLQRTGRCVGEVPSTGLADEKMTEDQFRMTISSQHEAEYCNHYLNERLRTPVPADMREIKGIGAAPITEEDVARGKKRFVEGKGPISAVDRLKRDLHVYVDLIEVKDGRLIVPQQLMKMEVFIRQFFEVKAE